MAGCAGATFHRILVTLFFVIILCTFLSLLFLIHFFYFQIFSVLIRMFHCQLYCSITATEKRRIRYIKKHVLSPTFTRFFFSRSFTPIHAKNNFATIALFLTLIEVNRLQNTKRFATLCAEDCLFLRIRGFSKREEKKNDDVAEMKKYNMAANLSA